MKSTYKCRRNGKHVFTKESNKEREICSQCHGFADRIKESNEEILTKSITAEVESTLIDDSVDYNSTDISSDIPSSSNDFSGGGGESGGGGASGEW